MALTLPPSIATLSSSLKKELSPFPEMHLPHELRLRRFMIPDYSGTYLTEGDQLIALNLAKMELQSEDLELLKGEEFKYLQALNLTRNTLTEWKIPINMKNLQYLDLSENTSLRTLNFSYGLPHLKHLYLNNCALQKIELPSGCEQLSFLDVSKNTSLKKIDISSAPQLRYLYAPSCSINELASPELSELTDLILNNNQINAIDTKWIERFPNLQNISLKGNPLPETILSNIGKDPHEDLAFLKRYTEDLDKASIKDTECKVLLVGNGNVGKTCLVRRMVHNKFDETYKSTHAIVLDRYPKPDEDNLVSPYQLNLWDFAGQDIYHATHRLFMKSGAVYLVLWDENNQPDQTPYQILYESGKKRKYRNHSLTYWLSYTLSQGKGSPAIVVQTKVSQGEEIDLPDIRQVFKKRFKYLEFWHINSKIDDWEDNGYEKLLFLIKQAVKKTKPQSYIPASWVALREKIRKYQMDHKKSLELADFYELALDYEEPMDVLNWLVQTGVVFYQQGLFNDEIILDQSWAIDAVYTLFNRKKAFGYLKDIQEKYGAFTGKDLREIWEQYSYKEYEQELFLSFMLSCELCLETTQENQNRYHIPFEERKFVAPQLLPEEKHTLLEDFWEREDVVLYLKYKHDFLHEGIIQSFIVRTHYLKSELGESRGVWKQGIQLKEGSHTALVEVDEQAPQEMLIVRVTAGGGELLDKIRNELDKLMDDESGNVYVSVNGKQYVDTTILEAAEREGKSQIISEEKEIIDIVSLKPFLKRDPGKQFIQPDKLSSSGSDGIKAIKKLIGDGNLYTAIERMLEHADAPCEDLIIQLKGRYSIFLQEKNKGKLSLEQMSTQMSIFIDEAIQLCSYMSDISTVSQAKVDVKAPSSTSNVSPASSAGIFETQVYFSYAWGDYDEEEISREWIVDTLYDSLVSEPFELLRDKKNIHYGGIISQFMKDMGKGDLVMVFITDKYVRSEYCMYELFEIARNCRWEKESFSNKILPVRVESVDFHDPDVVDEYYEHWEQMQNKWERLF